MPIVANEFPADFRPGSDFVQIEDKEFALASEPSGLIAIEIDDNDGYLTVAAAKRLLTALTSAVANSEAPRPDFDSELDVQEAMAGKHAGNGPTDEDIPF